MTTIYLKERIKPYEQYIREMVYANTVHCTDFKETKIFEPIKKKDSKWFSLLIGFLLSMLTATYAMMI